MAQYMFGTGRLTAMPQGGGAPVQFGALQNVSVDFSADVKELYGRNSFAVDAARGKMKVQGKASTGLLNVSLFNSVFFGQSTSTGQSLVSDSEAQTSANTTFGSTATTAGSASGAVCTVTVGSTTGLAVGQWITVAGCTPAAYNGTVQITGLTGTTITYTAASAPGGAITVQGTVVGASYPATAAQTANFLFDMGVQYASSGLYLTNVSGLGALPTQGQYTVSAAGVYQFNVADKNTAMLITYAYNSASTGSTLVINNTLMGSLPTFQVVANGLFKNKQITLTLYACVSNKFALPFKQDDYALTEFDFVAQDNGAGAIGQITATNT